MIAIDKIKNKPNLFNASEDFLDYAMARGFGDLHFKVDPETGMKAIIAIHSTKLGPALGGCRFIPYTTTEAAIYDAMRLARGMSYKSALANLPLGGGKSVIIQPTHPYNRQDYFHAFGRFVEELNGRYITALDSGTELSDMDIIGKHTKHVASLSRLNGDPSPYTAKGILRGIQAAVRYQLKREDLDGLHIAIQGLGHVGFALASQLNQLGVRLTVSDINPERVQEAVNRFQATAVETHLIHKTPCDVYAPCALGAVMNDTTIDELQTKIIAGAANNQLEHAVHGQKLHAMGILYAPDYVINAGGLIFAASQYLETPEAQVNQQIDQIGQTLIEIFERSKQENRPVSEVTDILAQEKLGTS